MASQFRADESPNTYHEENPAASIPPCALRHQSCRCLRLATPSNRPAPAECPQPTHSAPIPPRPPHTSVPRRDNSSKGRLRNRISFYLGHYEDRLIATAQFAQLDILEPTGAPVVLEADVAFAG